MANANCNDNLKKDPLSSVSVKTYNKHQIVSFLMLVAAAKMTTTYEEITKHLQEHGLGWANQTDMAAISLQRVLTNYLTDIFYWCKSRHLPPLTVLVVRKSGADEGLPGKGFWDLLYPEDVPLQFVDLDDRDTKRALVEVFQRQVFDYYDITR